MHMNMPRFTLAHRGPLQTINKTVRVTEMAAELQLNYVQKKLRVRETSLKSLDKHTCFYNQHIPYSLAI